ncbi:Bud4p SKDI_10G2910 [Saccharomyces kudriavzevii IFO 1802]|uniref:PH domain-containing protein n=1 Tax=Saccharomyces kudriavzevii (strain ATCC MYA-4449 / AS 2.2408 / CBS 8840 / NBRC 1802 / NCYC 2889) TaxID=226230 RepID=A0AA35J1M4_SACK1|nr:uncharacterized protein SKDI_10G2910 [Saccharomyces kudriavzevii IFO 1802]CAI4043962.1 hypothetical protein SKDI_10G2910 [Saccharomyces kudriavzevii IFO 1802]
MREAETTVDSLLKEIDNEMEQTKSNAMQKTTEDTSPDWKLPLQEIGDETMEMLVKHNTRSNSHAVDNRDGSPSRKSVTPNERFALSLSGVNSDLEEFPAAIHQERLKNSIANGSPRSTTSPKVLNNLKNMAHDIDDLTRDEESPATLSGSSLKFTLKSTQPLLSFPESPIHKSSIEIETNYDDGEEEEDAYTYLAQSPQILHSPSRIPITNAVSINKLNLDFSLTANDSDRRLSSDTSADSTEHELDTRTIPELPCCMSSTPEMTPVDEKCHVSGNLPHTKRKSHSDTRSPTASVEDLNISVGLPGTDDHPSNAVTTDTDVLIKRDLVKDLQRNRNHVNEAFVEKKILGECCEKKSVDFLGNNDTKSIEDHNNEVNDNNQGNLPVNVVGSTESAPLDHTESKFSDIDIRADNASETFTDVSISKRPEDGHINDYKGGEQEDLHHDKPFRENDHTIEQPAITLQKDTPEERSIELNDENEIPGNSDFGEVDHKIVRVEENQPVQGVKVLEDGGKAHDSRNDTDHGEDSKANDTSMEGAAEENKSSPLGNNFSVTTNGDEDKDEEKNDGTEDKNIREEEEGEQVPLLPPLPRLEAIQFSEPFTDENDTSSDSIDLTRSMKPSDYISIWHIQEEEIKSTSPESVANSQFSQQSSMTNASTIGSKKENDSTTFTFKPRIVSRSRIYNPKNRAPSLNYYDSDNYILSNGEWNALDPMRRNTLISKKIQDNIRTQKKLTPSIRPNIMKLHIENSDFQNYIFEEEQLQETEDVLLNEHASEQDITTNIYSVEQDLSTNTQNEPEISTREIENAGDITFNKNDLLSLSVDEELGQDFANFLDALDHDSTSFNHALDDVTGSNRDSSKKSFNSLWENNYELKPPPSIRNQSISPDVLQILLKSDSENDSGLENDKEEGISAPRTGLGIGTLKTPVKDVSIALAASIRGYEASFSDTDFHPEDTANSAAMTLNMFDSFEENSITPCTPTRSISPIKRHISSPFKVIKAGNKQNGDEINVKSEEEVESVKRIDVGSLKPVTPPPLTQTKEEVGTQLQESDDDVEEDFPDMGTLYLTVKGISTLSLYGTKSHRATYAIVFDNGENVIQTPWEALPYDGNIRINKEFELPINFVMNSESSSAISKENNYKKCVVTLKCKYRRPQHELVEVVDKVPVGKSFFGKTKYKFEKKYVQEKAKQDDWDFLFAQDGSFASCEIEIDDEFLNKVAFSNKRTRYDMINKWSRIADNIHTSKKLYELPRRAPHRVASLDVEACFLQRTAALEQFPKKLTLVNRIVSKYKLQQDIHKEGYLLQDGGDLKGTIENRLFKLHGSQLSGYHEISGKAKIDINLLKVTKVLRNEDIETDNDGQRNFTDWVLFNECFQLVFDDGERITFNAECSKEEKNSWYNKLKEVIDLNAFHQPWVKKLGEKLLM